MAKRDWFYPRGSLSRDGSVVVVDNSIDGWNYTGLRVHDLAVSALSLPAGKFERIIVSLSGDVGVRWAAAGAGGSEDLKGRRSVFDGPADAASFGPDTAVELRGAGRVAVAEGPAQHPRRPEVIRAADVAVELRGAGVASRQVHNFGVPGALRAEHLIVCEVITPAGNWSSYPPHKHDEATPTESRLEEIYYFEAAVERGREARDAEPFGMFATRSSPAGEIEFTGMVTSGDVALVPFGYHGPAAAAPGYDLYYLNVMAGPDPERIWKVSDDHRHEWIRAALSGEGPDPRLPYTSDPTGEE